MFWYCETMKKTAKIIRFLKLVAPAILLLALGSTRTWAQIIPTNTVIDWTHVGVRMAIPPRTNLIDVTQPPYNADKTGATDATAAIQTAINSATANQVVYIPDGYYQIAGALGVRSSQGNITIRGDTNSVLMGVGNSGSIVTVGNTGDIDDQITDTIVSGSTKGSTQITLSTTPSFAVGDELAISQSDIALGSAAFPIINVHQYDHNIRQWMVATAISGNTVTLSDPLMWNFTNAPIVMAVVGGIAHQVGIENLIITTSNSFSGAVGSYPFSLTLANCSDCWVTNCTLLYSHAYGFEIVSSSHLTIVDNTVRYSQGTGSDHSGIIASDVGGSLFANNILADGLEPAFEFNGGFCGNAVVGNFFTNNMVDIDNHNTHSMMNLWEQNVLSLSFEIDGYFGSSSHQTLLRNWVGSTYNPLLFKRWTTFMNVVGNVLGSPGAIYQQYTSEANNPSGAMIIQSGYPNIGNNSFVSSTPMPWNYPLPSYPLGDSSGQIYPAPICTLTSSQGPTNVLQGNFANITATIASQGGSVYSLQFQDNVNTNLYYPTNGVIVYATSAGTPLSVTLNTAVTVKSGWNVFLVGQNAWQQLQTSNKLTDEISGNYDYYHQAVTWDTNGVQPIPTSLIYANGAPGWWGTNRWPAIDPLASPMVATIPAQARYVNLPATTNSQAAITSPTNPIVQSATLLAPPSNLQVVAAGQSSSSGGISIAAGFVGWYQLGETSGSTANDSSGSGNPGTTVGSPPWQGPGVLLNGTSQYVVLAKNNGLPLYTTAVSNNATVSIWVYLGSANPDQVLYSEGGNGSGRFLMDFNNSGNPGKISIFLPSTYSPAVLRGNTTLSLNTWYNIVWTDNGGTAQLYINGAPDGANFNYTPAISSSTGGVAIGAVYDGQAGDTYGFTHGIIDDVRLWNYALPSSQASTIYNGGRNGGGGAMAGWWKLVETSGVTAHDSSGNTNTGTTIGSPTWGSPGVFLNGTNQYVVLAQNNSLPLYSTAASNSLTVSLWVYLEGASSDQVFYSESGNGSGRFLLDFNNSGNPGKISIFLPATYSPAVLRANTTLAPNTWYNIVWTDNGGTAQLYINSAPDGANFNYTAAISGGTTGAAIGAVYDGQAEDTYGFSHGIIADVRFWKYLLPSSQVSTIYNGGKATQ